MIIEVNSKMFYLNIKTLNVWNESYDPPIHYRSIMLGSFGINGIPILKREEVLFKHSMDSDLCWIYKPDYNWRFGILSKNGKVWIIKKIKYKPTFE